LVPEELTVKLKGSITNKLTGSPVSDVTILVYNSDSSRVFSGKTDSNGLYRIDVSSGVNYRLHAEKKLHFGVEGSFFIGFQPISEYSFEMQPIEEGATMALEHVLFEQGLAVLKEESKHELNMIVEMLKLNPEVNIFLGGHTDNQGKASSNLKLSKDRVSSVKSYLVSNGVEQQRITGKGYGGSKPRASNASPETRRLNRRVEITIHISSGDRP
jgi:outer membrane protein OmpA-like peptidoglycan-associated protein